MPGDAPRLVTDFIGRSDGDDLAAAHAGSGAEVDDQIGGPHGVFVVLDDHHGVAQIAQLRNRREQPLIVAGMQPDRRLVQDVQHADQPAADLPGQANPLRLAAGERRRGAIERQIIESHVRQKAEPPANLLERFGGDRRAGFVLHQLAEKLRRVADRQPAHLRQRAGRIVFELRVGRRHHHRPGLRHQSLAVAIGASDHAHVFFELADLHLAFRVAVFREQLGNDAVVGAAILLRRIARSPGKRDVLFAGSPQQLFAERLVQLCPGRFENRVFRQSELVFQRARHALIDVSLPAAEILPGTDQLDAALLERKLLARNQQRRIEAIHLAQPVTLVAHPLRAVKAKQLRRRRLEAKAAVGASVVGG